MELIQRHRVISSRITPLSHPHWFSPTFIFSSLRSIGGTGRSIGVSGRTVQAADTIPDSVVEQWNTQKAFTAGDDGTGQTSWAGELGNYTLDGGSPTVRENGINGNRALEYDGVDDGLSISSSNFTTVNQLTTIIAVVELNSGVSETTDYTIVGPHGDADASTLFDWRDTSRGVSGWRIYAGNNDVGGSETMSKKLITGIIDSTSSSIREDGVQTGTGSAGSNDLESVAVGYNEGGDFAPWDGMIGLVEIHDGLPSNGLSTREQEIANKWGITI